MTSTKRSEATCYICHGIIGVYRWTDHTGTAHPWCATGQDWGYKSQPMPKPKQQTTDLAAHEIWLTPARDIMARGIGQCLGNEPASRDAIEAATRACRALIAAGLTIEDNS